MELSCDFDFLVRFRGFVSPFLKVAGTGSAFHQVDRLNEELDHVDRDSQSNRCDARDANRALSAFLWHKVGKQHHVVH